MHKATSMGMVLAYWIIKIIKAYMIEIIAM